MRQKCQLYAPSKISNLPGQRDLEQFRHTDHVQLLLVEVSSQSIAMHSCTVSEMSASSLSLYQEADRHTQT